MGFFDELPAPEPKAALRRHQPWEPPQADLPGIVAIDTITLARSQDLAVAITGMAAHATGFEMLLTGRVRTDSDPGPGPGPGPVGGGADEPVRAPLREPFRFGMQLADGTKVFGRHGPKGPRRPEAETEPSGPILWQFMGGGGPRSRHARWWAWPLPPEGSLDFVFEWPAFGIPETRTTLDTRPILDAARRSVQLWPED